MQLQTPGGVMAEGGFVFVVRILFDRSICRDHDFFTHDFQFIEVFRHSISMNVVISDNDSGVDWNSGSTVILTVGGMDQWKIADMYPAFFGW